MKALKVIRLCLGFIAGSTTIIIVAESVEFAVVILTSDRSVEYLIGHHDEYFEVRNQPAILAAKMFYNSLAAFAGGFVMAWVTKFYVRIGLTILILTQCSALIWGGLFSDFSETGPDWMWVALTALTPVALFGGTYAKTWRG